MTACFVYSTEMKKLLLLFMQSFFAFVVPAQSFSGGILGGLNVSAFQASGEEIWFDHSSEYSARVAYHAGVYGFSPLSQKWSLRSAILYSSLGSESHLQYPEPNWPMTVDLWNTRVSNYLCLQVLMQHSLMDD